MRTYEFDTYCNVVVRVKARNQQSAEEVVQDVLQAMGITPDFIDGYNSKTTDRELVEVTFAPDESGPELNQTEEG